MAPRPLRIHSWKTLEHIVNDFYRPPDFVNGPTNSQATLRLFGKKKKTPDPPRVVLFRDNHAWCPYCQKVWLFLEEKQIPYAVRKVTMFCYGTKESWYKRIVPGGMLPALAIDNQVITESDEILAALESEFGPLGPNSMHDPVVRKHRQLERLLFRSWCGWLCREHPSSNSERRAKTDFVNSCRETEKEMSRTPGPYFGADFGISDTILAPYVERMQSSLFYYKGFNMRKEHPRLNDWFDAMETRETYRGTKSDHHTHVHDLPPQMGSCCFDRHTVKNDAAAQKAVDKATRSVNEQADDTECPEWEINEQIFQEQEHVRIEAIARVLKFQDILAEVNPYGVRKGGSTNVFDVSIRGVLSRLAEDAVGVDLVSAKASELGDEPITLDRLPPCGAQSLRYVRDRISIPRDMTFWAGRRLRQALEAVAREHGVDRGNEHPIPVNHRWDTTPLPFCQEAMSGNY